MRKVSVVFFVLLLITAVCCGVCFNDTSYVASAVTTSPYSVTIYSSDNGVTTGEANTVLQTSDGFIWIGGYGGLQRYDGVTFKQYSGTNGLTSYAIRSLFEASDKTLWIGSNDQGAFYYKDGVFKNIVSDDGLNLLVRSIAEDASGRIWLGTNDGLAYVENDKIVRFSLLEKCGFNDSIVYTLSLDNDGLLWGVDYAGSAFAIDTNSLTLKYRFMTSTQWADSTVWPDRVYAYSAKSLSNNRLVVGMNKSIIYIIDYSGETPACEIVDSGDLYSINAICETADGNVWLCGDGGIGVLYKTNDGYTYNDLSYIEKSSSLVNIVEDYERNIWIASTKYGVLNVRNEKVSKLVNTPELNDVETHAIEKYNDRWYVGAESGLFVFDSNWEHISNNLTTHLADVNIRDILADNNKIYVATDSSGLVIYDIVNDTYVDISRDDFSRLQLRVLIKLLNGDIAVGAKNGLFILHDDVIVSQIIDSNLKVLSYMQLDDGTLYLGTDGAGIYQYKDGAVSKYAGIENGLSSGVILRIVKDTNSGKMIVSCGNDVFVGNSDGFEKCTSLSSGSGSVVDIYIDEDVIWLFRTSGIIKCNKDAYLSGKSLDETFISQDDGIPGPIVANAWSAFDDKTFIICTIDGIGILDTENYHINTAKPQISLLSIAMDNNVTNSSNTVTLDKNMVKVKFSFAVLSYEDATVEYWLEGQDTNPILVKVADQHEAEYTNLKRGTYYFHLKAINEDGIESDEIVIKVVKEPKFIETGWFYAVIVVGVIIVVALIFASYIYRAKRKQKEYKALTDQSIATISGIIDAKDPYTNGHSQRVADFAVKVAKEMGLSKKDCERLYYIALLHDIGKIGVPDSILKKPSRLTDEEFGVIKHHVDVGGEVLSNFTVLDGVTEGALYHHERYDGTGYCKGLKGEEIPLFARIIAVADSYDAMNSSRCYRPAMDKQKIISELEKGRGTQFDRTIANIAIGIIKSEMSK